MPILDHIAINVSDYARSKRFYEKALAPLGIKPIMDFETVVGFGRDKKPVFWIGQGKASFETEEQSRTITPVHVCFAARSHDEVDAFYKAAMAAGGKDHGA